MFALEISMDENTAKTVQSLLAIVGIMFIVACVAFVAWCSTGRKE